VRGFAYPASSIAPMPGTSFVAFAGYFHGVAVGAGHIDGDARAEILAAPGRRPPTPTASPPSPTAAPPWPCSSTSRPAHRYGGASPAATSPATAGSRSSRPGRGPASAAQVTTWSFDGGTISAVPALTFAPYGSSAYGARLACFDIGSF